MRLLIILSFFTLFINCKEEKTDEFITIEPAEIADLTSEASSFKLKATLNADWTLVSSQSWCKISSVNGGAGTIEITVDVDANNTTQARTAVLTFRAGSSKKSYTIKQNKFIVQVSFADDNFKNFCITNFDTDKDGVVSIDEAAAVTTMNISNKGIASLAGIESFTSLQTLNCSNNSISSIDLTSLSALTSLNCANNKLTILDIQYNTNLTTFDCTGNTSLIKINVWFGFVTKASYSKPEGAAYITPEVATPLGYKLIWQDEFNDPRIEGKAVLPKAANWWYETGGGGWGNNELQNYIPAVAGSDTCAKIHNGTLKIVLKKVGSQILSVRMNTNQSWTYGYFEARLKLPVGKGTWPAFWMMPKNFTAWPDDGEIDIMEEVGYRPNYVSSSVHCKAYYHSIGTQKTAEKYVATAQTEFHVYAVEWTADFVKGYIDGVKYFEFLNDHQDNKNTWPFNTPFYLKLNLAWGGNWGGAQGVDESFLPATYEVDYVRVFQKN